MNISININQIDLKFGRETKCDMAILLNLVSKFLDLDVQTLVLDRIDPNSKDFSVTCQSKALGELSITKTKSPLPDNGGTNDYLSKCKS